jgi:hypothetical protein
VPNTSRSLIEKGQFHDASIMPVAVGIFYNNTYVVLNLGIYLRLVKCLAMAVTAMGFWPFH